MKLIRDGYELKTSQKLHCPKDIESNYSKKLLIYGTENETTMIAALIVK